MLTVPGKDADREQRVVYMIYPEIAGLSDGWLQEMADKYGVAVVMVYVPADKWNDVLTPWPEPGEAKGFPPFAGEGAQFLKTLQEDIIPQVEKTMGLPAGLRRDLIGVSLSGLFALWQWMQCDTFRSIACLSGSFWFAGFLDWFDARPIPAKAGKAYFLLGREEPHATVKAYRSVGECTEKIVGRLQAAGIATTFEWVPGNHFADPLGRAARAFAALM